MADQFQLIRMRRDGAAFPGGPVTADVHPLEEANYAAGGWQVDREEIEQAEAAARARAAAEQQAREEAEAKAREEAAAKAKAAQEEKVEQPPDAEGSATQEPAPTVTEHPAAETTATEDARTLRSSQTGPEDDAPVSAAARRLRQRSGAQRQRQ